MPSRSVLVSLAALLPLTFGTLARAEQKIAYVDLQRALTELEEGRAAKSRLQNMLDSKQKEFDKEQDNIRKEKDLLDKQASAMSEETRVQKQTDLQKKFFDLAQRFEKTKQDLANKERTELQAIFQKMDPIIATIAQREGFTFVFEKTDSGLVYAPPSLDVTNELVRLYNDQHKGKGGAGTTPSHKDKDAPKDSAKAPSDAPKQ